MFAKKNSRKCADESNIRSVGEKALSARAFQDVPEGAKYQPVSSLEVSRPTGMYRADRYILACLTKIARLAFATRSTSFATGLHIRVVCVCVSARVYLFNKFLTIMQTDFRFHAKCQSEKQIWFSNGVYEKFMRENAACPRNFELKAG